MIYWKEVNKFRKGTARTEETVKAEDGDMLNERGKRWAEYFEILLSREEGRETVIIAVGRERGMNVFGELNETLIMGKDVQETVKDMKTGKAAGLDICGAECRKIGGAMVSDGLVRLLNVCFVSYIVPVDWVSECVVPVYKGKKEKYECTSFRGTSLLSNR